jgi:hypothetical protein
LRKNILLRGLFTLFSIAPLTTSPIVAPAQQSTPAPASATGALSQMAASFSGGQIVGQVQLTGTATWTLGSLQDSGTVTLTASSSGSSQMQLNLASTGQRTETQTGAGSSAMCQWAGPDGIGHQISANNCWRSALWFLPPVSLQPSLLAANVGIVDLGESTVGSGSSIYRHLQSTLISSELPTGSPTSPAGTLSAQSTEDFGLDPNSFLPAVLTYSILPDSGSSIPIVVEVHFSNYQTVNGVQVPFLIQRYMNGSLQLVITINSVQIN